MLYKFPHFFGFIIYFFCSASLSAVSVAKLDSLEKALKIHTQEDTVRVITLINLGFLSRNVDRNRAITLLEEARSLSTKLNYAWGMGSSLMDLGIVYDEKGDFDKAMDLYTRSIAIFQKANMDKELSNSYLNMGTVYYSKGEYQKALDLSLKSLSLREKLNQPYYIASCLGNIGSIYMDMGRLDEALPYYHRAMTLYEQIQHKQGIATMCTNIGNLFNTRHQYEEALKYYKKGIVYRLEMKDEVGTGNSYINIGAVLSELKHIPESFDNLKKALEIFTRIGSKHQLSIIYANLGQNYALTGQHEKADEHIKKALTLISETGRKASLAEMLDVASNIYDQSGDYKKAFYYKSRYANLRDSILNDQTTKQISELQTKYDTQKKESQIKVQNLQLATNETEIKKQHLISWIIGAGLMLVGILAFFIFRGYSQKKKANENLQVAYSVIEDKNKIVEEKNKEILDSIHYAERIQGALLASVQLLEKNLPEYFVFYQPKDIVSGDFYWASYIQDAASFSEHENGSRFLLCTADCTGHGVPGAFMSLLNISFLNETITGQKILRPDLILNNVRTQIIKALNPDLVASSSKDGMDCTLCSFDFARMELSFACANNPLWLVRDGKLTDYPADKMPVGIHSGALNNFTLQKISLQKGDTIYTLTDGYADQFGGPKGKKFKFKQLQELILANSGKSLPDQKKILDQTISNWKGNMEQVDDILVIAVRI